jgi:hypothetical protein
MPFAWFDVNWKIAPFTSMKAIAYQEVGGGQQHGLPWLLPTKSINYYTCDGLNTAFHDGSSRVLLF